MQWLAIGSVVIYLGVAGAALTAYMVHESVILPEPVALERVYSAAPEEATTAFLIQAQLGAVAANQTIIAKKTRWTRRALRAFLAETVFLALILIAIAVTPPGSGRFRTPVRQRTVSARLGDGSRAGSRLNWLVSQVGGG